MLSGRAAVLWIPAFAGMTELVYAASSCFARWSGV